MSPRGNKSKGKPTSRFTHFRTTSTTDTTDTHEREAPPASNLSSPVLLDSDIDSDSDSSSEPSSNFRNSKPRVSKTEQFEAKNKKLAKGVGKSNRKLTPKEKKCLMKERKKVEKMESKSRRDEEMVKAELERGEADEFVESLEVEDE
jgi:hypothetical protein